MATLLKKMNHLLRFVNQRFEADNGVAFGLSVVLKFSGEIIPIWMAGRGNAHLSDVFMFDF